MSPRKAASRMRFDPFATACWQSIFIPEVKRMTRAPECAPENGALKPTPKKPIVGKQLIRPSPVSAKRDNRLRCRPAILILYNI